MEFQSLVVVSTFQGICRRDYRYRPHDYTAHLECQTYTSLRFQFEHEKRSKSLIRKRYNTSKNVPGFQEFFVVTL